MPDVPAEVTSSNGIVMFVVLSDVIFVVFRYVFKKMVNLLRVKIDFVTF